MTPFESARTTNSMFQLGSGESVLVPMMHRTANFKVAEQDDFQVLEMPYSSNRHSMVIFLPRKSDGLSGLEKKLTPEPIIQLLRKSGNRKVIVSVPRFKCRSGFGLAGTLQAFGMTDAFSNGADFSGITSVKPFFIEAVFHQAYVNVDEEGTEAAAATGLSHADSFPEAFDANHPFLFLIRDNRTGCILFLGRGADPSKA